MLLHIKNHSIVKSEKVIEWSFGYAKKVSLNTTRKREVTETALL